MDPSILGARIRTRREQLGQTIEVVAAKAGIRTMTLSYVERGGNTTIETASSIAKALGLSLGALFHEPSQRTVMSRKEAQDVAAKFVRTPAAAAMIAEILLTVQRETV